MIASPFNLQLSSENTIECSLRPHSSSWKKKKNNKKRKTKKLLQSYISLLKDIPVLDTISACKMLSVENARWVWNPIACTTEAAVTFHILMAHCCCSSDKKRLHLETRAARQYNFQLLWWCNLQNIMDCSFAEMTNGLNFLVNLCLIYVSVKLMHFSDACSRNCLFLHFLNL